MTSSVDRQPANLERFVIVHLSLKEMATGSGTEEGASLEELAESILYYFHNRRQVADAPESRLSSASVRLAGLGTALWSFPGSLTTTEPPSSNRRFQFVRLSKYSLLLAQLEKDILGIAQFSTEALVTPQAMAALIYRQYRIYCLFGMTPVQTSCRHPAMEEIYRLYKRKRQAMENVDDTDTAEVLQEKLDNLRAVLPIYALRTELGEYFDMFCADWENTRQLVPANGRSVVHLTPPPLPGTMPPQQIVKTDCREALAGICDQNEAILGFSVFANSLFEQTVTSGSVLNVDTETSHILVHHLASLLQRFPREHEPASPGFLRRTLGGLLQGDLENGKGSFLSPPPLSVLSTMVQEISFCTLNDERVWTPCISLDDGVQQIQVCLYNFGNYAFLVYLDPLQKEDFPEALSNFSVSVNEIPFAKPLETCEKWEKSGQTILWVDRPQHRAILYSSLCATRRISADPNTDMRHDLASTLSLDTLLAVDDAMQHAIQNFPENYEACTLLRHNWLVCRAQNGKELYAILSVKQFVTIQDVSIAMEEIEHQFALLH